MVHLNYYGIQNKYLLMLLCNSIAKLVYFVLDFELRGLADAVQYVINSFDFVYTGWIFFYLFALLLYFSLYSTAMKFTFVVAGTFSVCLSPHIQFSTIFVFARTLSVCFSQTEYYELFKWVFHLSGWNAFFSLCMCVSFACIYSMFSAASSISTACHFLIPCELIVCHFTSLSLIHTPLPILVFFLIGLENRYNFISWPIECVWCEMLLN